MIEDVETLRNELLGLQKKYTDIEEVNKNLNDRILELYSLYQISLTLSMTLDIDEILKSIKKLFKKTFQVDQYSIMLLNDRTEKLAIESSFGLSKADMNGSFEFGQNIFGAANKYNLIFN